MNLSLFVENFIKNADILSCRVENDYQNFDVCFVMPDAIIENFKKIFYLLSFFVQILNTF